jgi:hypothetical protein
MVNLLKFKLQVANAKRSAFKASAPTRKTIGQQHHINV